MKLLSVLLITLLLSIATFAQGNSFPKYPDEEVAVEFVYLRRNFEFRVPSGNDLTFDKANDSLGFRVGYWHNMGRENARGDVAIGVEGGATFHSVGESTVALGRGQFGLRLQRNKPGKTFRPFIKGTLGIARENFKDIVVTQNPDGGINFGGAEASFTYGGGVGFDIGKSRKRFRVGVEYFKTDFDAGPKHNVEFTLGVVL